MKISLLNALRGKYSMQSNNDDKENLKSFVILPHILCPLILNDFTCFCDFLKLKGLIRNKFIVRDLNYMCDVREKKSGPRAT